MKLHTPSQAPKEGEAPEKPKAQMVPTRQGYLRFLAESKAVYDVMERCVAEREEYAAFRNSGLERAGPLAEDIAWFKATYGMEPPAVTEVRWREGSDRAGFGEEGMLRRDKEALQPGCSAEHSAPTVRAPHKHVSVSVARTVRLHISRWMLQVRMACAGNLYHCIAPISCMDCEQVVVLQSRRALFVDQLTVLVEHWPCFGWCKRLPGLIKV